MNRRKLTVSVVGVLLAATAGLLFVFWNYELEETKRVMLTTTHRCPVDATEQIERAGEIGWLRVCIRAGARHGPFTYWKKQRKYAEGEYVDGRHVGKLKYFDETGQVIRVEDPR